MPPQFEVRDGTSNEEMRAGTLKKLKQVLRTGTPPPRCIFIVHGHKDQIEGMAQEVRAMKEEYKTDGRGVLSLLDTESMEGANEFFEKHRAHIKDPKG